MRAPGYNETLFSGKNYDYLQLYHKKIFNVSLNALLPHEQKRTKVVKSYPSTHSSPLVATSFFQMGTVVLSVSMI